MRKIKYSLALMLLITVMLFLPFEWSMVVAEIGFILLAIQLIYAVVVVLIRKSHAGKVDPFLSLFYLIFAVLMALIIYLIVR